MPAPYETRRSQKDLEASGAPGDTEDESKRSLVKRAADPAARPLVPPTPTRKLTRGESLAWGGGQPTTAATPPPLLSLVQPLPGRWRQKIGPPCL